MKDKMKTGWEFKKGDFVKNVTDKSAKILVLIGTNIVNFNSNSHSKLISYYF